MDAVIHQLVERRIDHPVALDRQLTGKRSADDPYMEVAPTLARMASVLVTFVQHVQLAGCERGLQALADLLNDGLPGHRCDHFTAALSETA